MTSEDIQKAAYEGTKSALREHHICLFDEEERQLLKDFIKLGNMFKGTMMKFLVIGTILIICAVIISTTHMFNITK